MNFEKRKDLKESGCWIYGYTLRNLRIAEAMKRSGFEVKGFIDKNAELLKKEAKETIVSKEELSGDIEKDIIIILLLSVNSHIKVAKEMNSMGWKFILFMAVGEGFEDDYVDEMRKMYNRLINMEFSEDFWIPEYKERYKKEKSVLRLYQDKIVVYLPIDMLFVDTEEHIRKVNGKIREDIFSEILKYADKNIIRMKLYREFFDTMLLGSGNGNDYIKIYSVLSGKDKKEYLQERLETLLIWEQEYLRIGMSYFIDGAAEVKFNEKRGYFNISDGMHRLMYLLYKGNFDLPVTMTLEDYYRSAYIKNIREQGKNNRDLYRQRLCFLRFLDKLDLILSHKNEFDEAIVISSDIYWPMVFKQNDIANISFLNINTDCELSIMKLLTGFDIDLVDNLTVKETCNYIIFTDDTQTLTDYEDMFINICTKGGLIFALIDIDASYPIGNCEVLYRDYEKKLICYS